MISQLAIIYGKEFLSYDFGPDHPFAQVRLDLTVRLMEALGLLQTPGVSVLPPVAAALDDVLRFHDSAYIECVSERCSLGEGWLDDARDTPAFPAGLDASLFIAGGTLRAVDLVVSGQFYHAFNLGGGLHHAFADRAAGFCIINDVAVAIRELKRRGFQRIMYLDIDAHHGDGVMYSFYDDGGVLDIDFHEDGRYLFPGRGDLPELGVGAGLNHKVNVPFPRYAGDKSFRYAFVELVPALARRYCPEIILMQCGVDAHADDPLSDLRLSINSYVAAIDVVHQLAHELCDGRLVLFGGGGYDPGSAAITWARLAAVLVAKAIPELVPEVWHRDFERLTGRTAPVRLTEHDGEDYAFDETRRKVVWLKQRLGLG